jgi:hypothetical protein
VIEKIYKKNSNSWIGGENRDYGKWWANGAGKPQANGLSLPKFFFSSSYYLLY